MISKSMTQLVQGNSVIRALFEEGREMAREVGAENVYDFSLGNPSVPAPEAVRTSMKRILDGDNSLYVHGYMSNAGYEEVREAVAASLNKRFGRSEEHTSELQSQFRISYAVFCLKKKNFFNDTATTEIYTLSLHDALPILSSWAASSGCARRYSPAGWGSARRIWSRRPSWRSCKGCPWD